MNLSGFLPIVGYDLPYMINQNGVVYSPKLNRPLKQKIVKSGYSVVRLTKNGRSFCTGVHRLVAIAFIPNKDKTLTIINHKDGNKLNNNISNLEWCNHKQNSVHFITHLNGSTTKPRGYGWNKKARLTDENVRLIRALRQQKFSLAQIQQALIVKTSVQTISQICLNKIYKHIIN